MLHAQTRKNSPFRETLTAAVAEANLRHGSSAFPGALPWREDVTAIHPLHAGDDDRDGGSIIPELPGTIGIADVGTLADMCARNPVSAHARGRRKHNLLWINTHKPRKCAHISLATTALFRRLDAFASPSETWEYHRRSPSPSARKGGERTSCALVKLCLGEVLFILVPIHSINIANGARLAICATRRIRRNLAVNTNGPPKAGFQVKTRHRFPTHAFVRILSHLAANTLGKTEVGIKSRDQTTEAASVQDVHEKASREAWKGTTGLT